MPARSPASWGTSPTRVSRRDLQRTLDWYLANEQWWRPLYDCIGCGEFALQPGLSRQFVESSLPSRGMPGVSSQDTLKRIHVRSASAIHGLRRSWKETPRSATLSCGCYIAFADVNIAGEAWMRAVSRGTWQPGWLQPSLHGCTAAYPRGPQPVEPSGYLHADRRDLQPAPV